MIELRYLRTAIVLAEELHFGRSAQRLRVAQSAVSQSIKTLEAEVGVLLFERTRRSVRLTPAGAQFVEGARRVLAELTQTTASLQGVASGDAGRLAVRFVPMASLSPLPQLITRFRAEHPAVGLTAEPATSSDQLDALRAGRCDVGFVPLATTRQDLEPLAYRIVTRSPLVALVSSRHRLATRRWIRLDELASEAFAVLAQAGEPRLNFLFRRRCQQAGFDPNIVLEAEHTDVLIAFVAAGYAVSYVPELVLELGSRDVVGVPVRPTAHGGIVAIWNPRSISAAGRRFLATLP